MSAVNGKYELIEKILLTKPCTLQELADRVYPHNSKSLGLIRKRRLTVAMAYLKRKGIIIIRNNKEYQIVN